MPPAWHKAPEVVMPHKAGCTGKHGFASRADALSSTRRHTNLRQPYECSHCGAWHVSTRGRLTREQALNMPRARSP